VVTLVILKQPSALLPLVMSGAALAIVLGHIAVAGVAREPDEGTAAHLWQLLMAGQVPAVMFFAIRWFPRRPTETAPVLVLHVVAALAALAPVFLLRW
jgi:hypothetical protein